MGAPGYHLTKEISVWSTDNCLSDKNIFNTVTDILSQTGHFRQREENDRQ